MSGYQEQVAAVLAATQVHSRTGYSWFGRRIAPLPKAAEKAMSADTARQYLRHRLQSQLYEDFYCQGGAVSAGEVPGVADRPGFTPFVAALSDANTGQGSREEGWQVRAVQDGRVVVEQDRLRLWVRVEEVITAGGSPPEAGDAVLVRLPKELLKLSPGFYMALGDDGLPRHADEPMVRFYWNLRSDTAPELVRELTSRLNQACIPFRLKVVNDPRRYTRCDAGVLYVLRRDYRTVAAVVRTVHDAVRDGLSRETPALTKQLAPGLGLAEEPPGGDSFGTHRCGLLADGIIRARDLGRQSLADRMQVVVGRLEEEGISLEAPFLNAGSSDVYVFAAQTPSQLAVP